MFNCTQKILIQLILIEISIKIFQYTSRETKKLRCRYIYFNLSANVLTTNKSRFRVVAEDI